MYSIGHGLRLLAMGAVVFLGGLERRRLRRTWAFFGLPASLLVLGPRGAR